MQILRLRSVISDAITTRVRLRTSPAVSYYSTGTRTPPSPSRAPVDPWKEGNELYRRISPVSDPKVSIVPVLDQWIEEGRHVDRCRLQGFIKELRYFKRYAHALEISFWMTDKRFYSLTKFDVAIRLDLMSKIHGIKEVEDYFASIHQNLKSPEVYGALLNCYVYRNSVEKAEAHFQRMKELGFVKTFTYNVMLNLYCKTGYVEKIETLILEMDDNGIKNDKYTYAAVMSAYGAVSDIERMDKVVEIMRADTTVVLDWATYAVAATAYRKVGLFDKAFAMLKKSEGLITMKRRQTAYCHLLTQYAALGNKDEVLRLWKVYKKNEKVYNKGYIDCMTSLVKFDDLESVLEIFKDWELQNLIYDIRIPNILIDVYCRRGLSEKAEALVNHVKSKGGNPNAYTHYLLALGYLRNNETPKAVGMMKKAIDVFGSRVYSRLSHESLATFLNELKEIDPEQVNELINLLRDKGVISQNIKA